MSSLAQVAGEATFSDRAGLFYIGGEWVQPLSAATVPVIEPATGRQLALLPEAGPQDVDRAVRAARAARADWAAMPPEARADLMEQLAAAVEARADAIARTISRQNGTPVGLAQLTNPDAMSGILRYHAALTRAGWAEERRTAITFDGTVHIQRRPVGVVAVIVPWNYPIGLMALKLAPALAAGCTVVLKPAPETSLDATLLAEAVAEAGIPAGVVNLVTGGRETGDHLVRHPFVDKVSFTGSTAAGRIIGAACGQALKPVTLELGGKSAALILDDADLPTVLTGLTTLSFINAGQTCYLNSRVLAPRSIYDAVVDGLAEVARSFVLGDPLDARTTMGPLVTERQRERVETYIATGRSEGARLVTGGGRPDGLPDGWFVEPTVFADVANSMVIAQEEIFGPVIGVIPYDTVDDAVAIANDSDYGLAGTVWTTDSERGLDVARRIDTGSIGLNMWTIDPTSPFGGWKSSGMGKEMGPEGLAAYFDTKTIFVPGKV